MSHPNQIIEQIISDHNLFPPLINKKKVLLALSGGLDSTVVLYFVRYLGLEPIGIQFNYQLRPKVEQTLLKKICKLTDTSLITFQYPKVKKGDLTTFRHGLAEANSLHYLIAANFAAVNGIELVFGGLIKNDWDDPEGQNSKHLIDRINHLVSIEFDKHPPQIIMPFIYLNKIEVVKLGRFLNVPLEQTWSCEKDMKEPCGVCGNCEIRKLSIQGQTHLNSE